MVLNFKLYVGVHNIAGYTLLGEHRGKGKWGHPSYNPDSESSIGILGERVHHLQRD